VGASPVIVVLRQKRVRLTSRLFVPVRQANTPGEWWR
jgi:hypothetical protein